MAKCAVEIHGLHTVQYKLHLLAHGVNRCNFSRHPNKTVFPPNPCRHLIVFIACHCHRSKVSWCQISSVYLVWFYRYSKKTFLAGKRFAADWTLPCKIWPLQMIACMMERVCMKFHVFIWTGSMNISQRNFGPNSWPSVSGLQFFSIFCHFGRPRNGVETWNLYGGLTDGVVKRHKCQFVPRPLRFPGEGLRARKLTIWCFDCVSCA